MAPRILFLALCLGAATSIFTRENPVQGGVNADGWRCVTERSHITIGYAASMNGFERRQLQRRFRGLKMCLGYR